MNRKLIRIYQKCVDQNGVSFVLIKNLRVEDATTDTKLNLFLLFIGSELEASICKINTVNIFRGRYFNPQFFPKWVLKLWSAKDLDKDLMGRIQIKLYLKLDHPKVFWPDQLKIRSQFQIKKRQKVEMPGISFRASLSDMFT